MRSEKADLVLVLGLLVLALLGVSLFVTLASLSAQGATAPPTTLRIAVGLAGQAPVYIGQTSHLEWIGEPGGLMRVRWTTPTGTQEISGTAPSFVVQAIGHAP